jgi:hypothetical protein
LEGVDSRKIVNEVVATVEVPKNWMRGK